ERSLPDRCREARELKTPPSLPRARTARSCGRRAEPGRRGSPGRPAARRSIARAPKAGRSRARSRSHERRAALPTVEMLREEPPRLSMRTSFERDRSLQIGGQLLPVDVSAGEDDSDSLSLKIRPSMAHGGRAGHAGGLDQNLHALEHPGERL